MSDIRIYSAANMPTSPLTGDVVLCTDEFNGAQANSVHLCTNATGPLWKSFANDAAAEAFVNRWGASFNGTTDYLDTSNKFDFIQQTCNFSFTFWLKLSNYTHNQNQFILASDQAYIWYDNRGGNSYSIKALRIKVGNAFSYDAPNTFNDNDWHHVAATCSDGGFMKLYVDGAEILSDSAPPTSLNSATNNFRIGINSAGALPFGGNLDEVAIFDTELSADDITKIYNGTAPNGKPTDLTLAASYNTDRTSNLKGYWRMGDDSNDSPVDAGNITGITDSSGNGNDATTIANAQPTFSALTSSEKIYV